MQIGHRDHFPDCKQAGEPPSSKGVSRKEAAPNKTPERSNDKHTTHGARAPMYTFTERAPPCPNLPTQKILYHASLVLPQCWKKSNREGRKTQATKRGGGTRQVKKCTKVDSLPCKSHVSSDAKYIIYWYKCGVAVTNRDRHKKK